MKSHSLDLQSPTALLTWYQRSQRPLPWRQNRDPYRIWISEVMLQQTTVAAVAPYFERFVKAYPTLQKLAQARLPEVLALWSGLGYYSRARNLHRAALALVKLKTFPTSHLELLELPGFGPYTARAVSSLAFDEAVGVVDGNTIRVLSRYHRLLNLAWWTPKGRAVVQSHADQWVNGHSSAQINQALMELGATLCRPVNPTCLLCPISKNCGARQNQEIEKLPHSKPKSVRLELWSYKPELHQSHEGVGLIRNQKAPFLRGEWLWPGGFKKIARPPKSFAFKHSITKYMIFVSPQPAKQRKRSKSDGLAWFHPRKLKAQAPSSLVHKSWEVWQK